MWADTFVEMATAAYGALPRAAKPERSDIAESEVWARAFLISRTVYPNRHINFG